MSNDVPAEESKKADLLRRELSGRGVAKKPHANPRKQGDRAVEIAPRECRCGHDLGQHHSGACLVLVDVKKAIYCKCNHFIPKVPDARK